MLGFTPIDLFILIKILRHTGRDCRYLGHMEVNIACHPWLLDSGNPCRKDVSKC